MSKFFIQFKSTNIWNFVFSKKGVQNNQAMQESDLV
jgi:hypothetical protein